MRAAPLKARTRAALQGHGANAAQEHILVAVLAIVALIFLIGAPMLNLVMPYSSPGGNFLMKFHPASWIALPLFPLLLQFPAANPLERHYRTAAFLFALICILLALEKKGALMSTILDIHVAPAILLAALSRLPFERARVAPALFVRIAAFNVVLVAVEFALRTPILPRESHELFFRPAGFFAHPINAGILFCCAMLLLMRGVLGTASVRPLMLLFLFGTVLCGVRGPLAVAGTIFLANIIRPALPRRSALDYVLDFGALIAVPIGVAIALSIGAFDRILALGLWEKSSQSRFHIFEALDWITNNEFWWGIDSNERMELLAGYATGGRDIENSVVLETFAAGFPVAILASFAVFFLHAPALRRSLLAVLLFAVAALATIAFSTKSNAAAGLALAGYWVWRSDFERKTPCTATGLSRRRSSSPRHSDAAERAASTG